ncbi:MAG: class I SAM-dependent methyltransferase [Candidatus Nanohaloarchaea archaeon]
MREEVREGYEKGDYESDYRRNREIRQMEERLFEEMLDRVPEGPKVLDLGCGIGEPFDRYLVEEGCDMTGVDIAEKHVKKARENVPGAEFMQGDFFEQDFADGSFDAVVSFYAIFHIPREEHGNLFGRIHRWLKEDGVILVTLGGGEMDEHRDEIGGAEMLWSSYTVEENRELVEEAGFDIIEDCIEEEEGHLWILAEKR